MSKDRIVIERPVGFDTLHEIEAGANLLGLRVVSVERATRYYTMRDPADVWEVTLEAMDRAELTLVPGEDS